MGNAQRIGDKILKTYGFERPSCSEGTLFELLPLSPIRDEKEYTARLGHVDKLMALAEKDKAKYNELTLNGSYLSELARLVEDYEKGKFPIPKDVSGVEMLKFLMEQNSLTQVELAHAVFGGHQGNLSRILSGKNRGISKESIKKLSEYFNVPANVFL